MTLSTTTKKNDSKLRSKQQPIKRATSPKTASKQRKALPTLRKVVKFSDDSHASHTISDTLLQPSNPRRRYMRRGSRCPSMFHVQEDNSDAMMDVQPTAATPLACLVHSDANCSHPPRSLAAARRLSLVSALKVSLEKLSFQSHTHRHNNNNNMMTAEERRQSTIELLSSAAEL